MKILKYLISLLILSVPPEHISCKFPSIFKTLSKSINFFLNDKFWINDGPLEYHRATSGTTRSYPSPLGIMPIHQFRRKPNKYGKTPLWESNPGPIGTKALSHPKIPLGYKAMGTKSIN
ncbi:hypothetical protein Hanom_Chr04g00292811 [Helianthus anomalus]